jgi:hypothetical protein
MSDDVSNPLELLTANMLLLGVLANIILKPESCACATILEGLAKIPHRAT